MENFNVSSNIYYHSLIYYNGLNNNLKSKISFTKQVFKKNKFDSCDNLFDIVYIFLFFFIFLHHDQFLELVFLIRNLQNASTQLTNKYFTLQVLEIVYIGIFMNFYFLCYHRRSNHNTMSDYHKNQGRVEMHSSTIPFVCEFCQTDFQMQWSFQGP